MFYSIVTFKLVNDKPCHGHMNMAFEGHSVVKNERP